MLNRPIYYFNCFPLKQFGPTRDLRTPTKEQVRFPHPCNGNLRDRYGHRRRKHKVTTTQCEANTPKKLTLLKSTQGSLRYKMESDL